MKRKLMYKTISQGLLTFGIIIYLGAIYIVYANTTLYIPMNFDHWQTNSTDNWEQSEDGIMLYGKQDEMTSKKMFNFIDSQVFIKWKGQYPYLRSATGNALLADSLARQRINLDKIWYYSRITVNNDNTYTGVTAIDNYMILMVELL